MTLAQPHCDLLYDGQSLWTGYVTFGMCQITRVDHWERLACEQPRRVRKLVFFHHLQYLLQL